MLTFWRVEQILVPERERLVVVVEFGERRVVEQIGECLAAGVNLEVDTDPILLPTTPIVVLVFPTGGVAGSRAGLDVIRRRNSIG